MSNLLAGKRVLVTREKQQAAAFAAILQAEGAISVQVPLLKIDCRHQSKLENMATFQWVFFTSAHGVQCFFSQFQKSDLHEHVKFATVGHKTEVALLEHGYKASFIPSVYNAETMAAEFFNEYPKANDILLVRGNISRKILVDELTKRQLHFNTIVVYETNVHLDIKAKLIDMLTEHSFDYLTFTSPSTVKAFIEMVENHPMIHQFLKIPAICIGTTTEKAAKDFKFEQTYIPNVFTIESMVEKMIELEKAEEIK